MHTLLFTIGIGIKSQIQILSEILQQVHNQNIPITDDGIATLAI